MSTKKISLVEVLIWIFSILLVVVVASPFALGFKIQNDYSVMLRNLSNILQVDIRVMQYNRGFFSSSAIIEYAVPNSAVNFRMQEEIIHGPVYLGLINQGKSPLVAAVIKGNATSSPASDPIMRQLFSGNNALVYQNLIDFAGNFKTEGYLPPINKVIQLDAVEFKVRSSGMVFTEHYSAINGTLTGEVSVPSFNLSEIDTNINLQDMKLSFHGSMGQNGLMMGDSVLALAKLDIKSLDEQFAMHNLNVRSITSEHGVLVDSQAQVNVREIYASNQKLGPVSINASVNGLNARSIKQLQAAQKEIEAKVKQGVPPEQINAMMAGQMLGLLPDLFKQAEIKVMPVSIESEMGKLEANFNLAMEGLDNNAPADPLFMLNAINLKIDFSVDEPLMRQLVEWQYVTNQERLNALGTASSQKAEADIQLEQKVTENLQGMLDENWLVFENGTYKSDISLQQGVMTLNDKSVDPMQQIMSQMSAPAGTP